MVSKSSVEHILLDIGFKRNADGWLYDENLKMANGKPIFCEGKVFKVECGHVRGFNDDGISLQFERMLNGLGWYFEVYRDGVYVLASLNQGANNE